MSYVFVLKTSRIDFQSVTGAPELCGSGRRARTRLAVGQTRNAGRPGLCPSHPSPADRNVARGRSGHLPQRPSVASPHGQSKIIIMKILRLFFFFFFFLL